MKKLIFLFLIVLLSSCSCQPTEFVKIYGVVKDSATGEKLENAEVLLAPTNQETKRTKTDGYFEFNELDMLQDYEIQVTKDGYITNRKTIENIVKNTEINIQLIKKQ